MGWLTVVLWLDRAGGGGGLWLQRGLGVLTWGVLLLALRRVSPMVRAQTVVVVAFATCIEYVFSPTLEVYTYRFHNVPAFVFLGPSQPVYVGAFVAVSWLEVVGTHLGTWAWGTLDPTGWVTIGNPPSGAAGGYGWFDLAGLLAAPYLLTAWDRVTRRRRAAPEPQAADVH